MQEKSLIKRNILQYLEFKGITKYKFYQETGITRGVLDQKTGMSEENTAKFLAHYSEVSPDWLISDKGSMLRNASNDEISPIEVREFRQATDDNRRTNSVPLYNIEAVAGVVAIFDDLQRQEPVDYITIPNLPKCDGAVHVVGDSMYPLLKSGDIIAYKILNNKENIFWGEMYLLSISNDGDNYVTVKYVQRSERDGYVKLVSQNQNHQDRDIPFDSIRFAALVKASIRINSMG